MLRRIGSFTQHRNFLIRLVTYTMLVCFVPLMVIGTFLYYSVQNSVRKDAEMANERYLNQTINSMELVVRQVANGFRQFVTSNTFIEFDKFPVGSYFQAIDQWRYSSDKDKIYDYIKSKSDLQKSMQDLMAMNEFIYSIYYINPVREIVLTSGYKQYEPKQFYDPDWNRDIDLDVWAFPVIMNVRDARQEDGSFKQVIPIVFRTVGSPYTLVINLDAQVFYNHLISRFNEKGNTSLIVYTREGEPQLYDPAQAEEMRLVQSSIKQEEDKVFASNNVSSKKLTNKQLVIWRYSEVLGWNIAGITNLQEIYRNVASMRSLFIIVAVLLVVVTTALAIISSRRMYRPVRHLLQFVKEGVQYKIGKTPKHSSGEFQVISDGLFEAFHRNSQLQQRLRESLPAQQEKFIRSLLTKHDLSLADIKKRFDYLGIELDVSHIVPFIVSIENRGKGSVSMERETMEQLLVTDTIMMAIDTKYSHWLMELTEADDLILVNVMERSMSMIFAIAEKIKQAMALHHNIVCTIGIGSYCETIDQLPRAYDEAQEALQYRGMTSGGEIIYIEDVRLRGSSVLPYPKEKEETLLICLKNGDEAKTLALFNEWDREMKVNAGLVSFKQVQQAYLLLLVSMIKKVQELNLDINEIVAQQNLLEEFWHKDDWREITPWFIEIIRAITTYIGQAFQEKKNAHVELAKQMISSSEAEKLSLAMIADQLNLNPAYLSRIFKEYTGVTFTDYVIRTRMDMGIQLLLNSDLKVQEISSQLGYAKVTHFIKLFKETTGITPGEYRKQHT